MDQKVVDQKSSGLRSIFNAHSPEKVSLPEMREAFLAQTDRRRVIQEELQRRQHATEPEIGYFLIEAIRKREGNSDLTPPYVVREHLRDWAREQCRLSAALKKLELDLSIAPEGVSETSFQSEGREEEEREKTVEASFGFEIEDPNTPPVIRAQMEAECVRVELARYKGSKGD